MSDNTDDHEPTNRHLRQEIAKRTAHRPPETALNKEILNSAHAWFTGEFAVQPVHLQPGSPTYDDLLEQTLREAIAAYDHPTDPDKDDLSDHPADALIDYLDEVEAHDREFPPRPMRKRELRQFLNAMATSGDNRQWSIENR